MPVPPGAEAVLIYRTTVSGAVNARFSSAPMSAAQLVRRESPSMSVAATWLSEQGPIPLVLAVELDWICRFSLPLVVDTKAIFATVMVVLLLLLPHVPSSDPL